jgi:hypothetical protein
MVADFMVKSIVNQRSLFNPDLIQFTSLNGLLIKAELWFYLVYPPRIKISERKRTFAKLFS